MKKYLMFLGMGLLMAACSHDDFFKAYEVSDAERTAYAEKTLGVKIDPRQDWILTKKYSVTITADADLDNIREVMVLNGNPYAGVTYRLAHVALTNGGTTTLEFQAPLSSKDLYVACLSADKHCIARPFVPGIDVKVSFAKVETEWPEAAREGRAMTRAETGDMMDDQWAVDYKFLDLPGKQDEVHAFLPDKQDNRAQVKALNSYVLETDGSDSKHVILNYIYGHRDGQGAYLGFNAYPTGDPESDKRQTFLINDDINPNNFYTYNPPYYETPHAALPHRNDDGIINYKQPAGYTLDFFVVNSENSLIDDQQRTVLFRVNGNLYLAMETGDDWDFNDKVFLIDDNGIGENVPDAGVEPEPTTPQVWTYAWEDKDFGDYDMNDCVISVKENAEDHSKLDITLLAVGAERDVRVYFNATDEDVFGVELHAALGMAKKYLTNTSKLDSKPITVTRPKPAGFDFQTNSFKLWVGIPQEEWATYGEGNYFIYIPTIGQDPHAVVIPGEWAWPTEGTSIIKAYPKFRDWAQDITDANAQDWYLSPVSNLTMKIAAE